MQKIKIWYYVFRIRSSKQLIIFIYLIQIVFKKGEERNENIWRKLQYNRLKKANFSFVYIIELRKRLKLSTHSIQIVCEKGKNKKENLTW